MLELVSYRHNANHAASGNSLDRKETSDVDILVEFEEPTFRNFMGLAFFLEGLFGREVDLVTTKGLSPYIRPHVEKEVIWSG